MEKNILVIYYTQTGQLGQIVDNFIQPLAHAPGITIEKVAVELKNEHVFPWTSDRFFDTMPESVLGIPAELKAFTLKRTAYDLIIFAYQPWYLSPSIPATSILQNSSVQAVMKNTPVITLIGARNMWLNAQEKIKKILKSIDAQLVGNIALIDKHNNHLSAVSILYWMLSGKKERYLSVFPKPGVSDQDIQSASVFGKTVLEYLNKNDWNGLQNTLIAQKAVEIKPNLMFIEQRAGRLFSIWANLIITKQNRKPWVTGFKYYLLIALFIVAPIVVGVNEILFKPFLKKQINKKKQHYQGLN
ncbi:MAG: hypothetical protein ACTHJT_13790 [Cytophaga sp.]|uniref:hypothetical protein n=1 Tax=Cytophaga sp. TaxID=29535 RepID=UPI003F7CEE1F